MYRDRNRSSLPFHPGSDEVKTVNKRGPAKRPHQCQECLTWLSSRYALEGHQKAMHGKRIRSVFLCPILSCKKSQRGERACLVTWAALIDHLKKRHDELWGCHCHALFHDTDQGKAELQKHRQRWHDPGGPKFGDGIEGAWGDANHKVVGKSRKRATCLFCSVGERELSATYHHLKNEHPACPLRGCEFRVRDKAQLG